jgi:hypothetical protein
VNLLDTATGARTSFVQQLSEPLQTKQLSPRVFNGTHWEFDWQTVAYECLIPGPSYLARFSVFSQERQPTNDTALAVTRMLSRLWEYGYRDLRHDHSAVFGDGLVDVYMCKGGDPGGEQRFDEDSVNGRRPTKVNTIYFYDLATFKDPMEMAREVAHEYGHASIQGVNGYKEPEDWANGFLGEKLFLNHVAKAMAAAKLAPEDAMGVSKATLDTWVGKNVRPLIIKGAALGPNLAALKARDKQGMDNFIGLALYVDTILPENLFGRSLDLLPSSNAQDYPDAVVIAAQPVQSYHLNIPDYLVGSQIWVPVGDSKLVGVQPIDRKLGWAKIKAPSTPVQVVPPNASN